MRYSKTFFDVACEQDRVESVKDDLVALQDILNKHKEYHEFFLSSIVPTKMKYAFLDVITQESKLTDLTIRFLRVLIKNNRIFAIQEIIEEYFNSLDKHNNELRVDFISAADIDSRLTEKITQELARILNKKIKLVTTVKEEIIGGFVINVHSKMLDCSISSQLNKIRKITVGI